MIANPDSFLVCAELLDALPAAIYTTDAEGKLTYYNQAAAELWGHRPELGSSQWCGSWRLFWPDGRPLPHDQCPMATTLKEGRAVGGVGGNRRKARWHACTFSSLSDPAAR